jgi:hypothetical protein
MADHAGVSAPVHLGRCLQLKGRDRERGPSVHRQPRGLLRQWALSASKSAWSAASGRLRASVIRDITIRRRRPTSRSPTPRLCIDYLAGRPQLPPVAFEPSCRRANVGSAAEACTDVEDMQSRSPEGTTQTLKRGPGDVRAVSRCDATSRAFYRLITIDGVVGA